MFDTDCETALNVDKWIIIVGIVFINKTANSKVFAGVHQWEANGRVSASAALWLMCSRSFLYYLALSCSNQPEYQAVDWEIEGC